MGVFNRAIPKYIRRPDGSITVEPTIETVQVDDAFDPVLNKAVREQYMSNYGNPFSATAAGYADLINNALLGNKKQGGTMLPGIGILSGFGRTMDKAGDFILGGFTEGVKGITGQGIESPMYNIFVEDEDYSGQRFLAAAANSMAKMANAPELTEDDFKGLWSVPSLGIELATDPSIMGGGLTKLAKGTGAVADAGRLLQEYDDIMAKFAIDATAPGLRPLGKKFGARIGSYLSNHRKESGYTNAALNIDNITNKAVIDYGKDIIDRAQFDEIINNVNKQIDNLEQTMRKDITDSNLQGMQDEIAQATQNTSPPNIVESLQKEVTSAITKANAIESGTKKAATLQEAFDSSQLATRDLVNQLNKEIPVQEIDNYSRIDKFRSNPNSLFEDYGVSRLYLDDTTDATKNFENMSTIAEEEFEFTNRLPPEFTTNYDIKSREEFIKFANSFKTAEETKDLEQALRHLERTNPTSTKGYVKVSKSASKLPPRIQLFVNAEQQKVVSDIIEAAVRRGVIDPKTISEGTLDEIFDKFDKIMYGYTSNPTNKYVNQAELLNHYSYNPTYLKKIIKEKFKDAWDMPKLVTRNVPGSNVPTFVKNQDRFLKLGDFKTPDTQAKYYAKKIAKEIQDFYSSLKGVPEERYAQLYEEFINKKALNESMDFTYKDLMNRFLADDTYDTVPLKGGKRFNSLNSRQGAKTAESSKEFKKLYELVENLRKHTREDGMLNLRPLPLVFKESGLYPKYQTLTTKKGTLLKEAVGKKRVKDTLNLTELYHDIEDIMSNYETYVGSKVGSRIFDESSEAFKTFGKTTSDTSTGLTKAINDILARKNFKTPQEIYDFLHKKFKTSQGDVSLAYLGYEVTHLPKPMLDTLQKHTTDVLTKSVTFKKETTSLLDLVYKKLISNTKDISSDIDVADIIISKEDYAKYFEDSVGMSWNEFSRRILNSDITTVFKHNGRAVPKEFLLERISNPDLYLKSWLNDYKYVKSNPNIQYLNRLNPELGTFKGIDYNNLFNEKYVKSTVFPADLKHIKNLTEENSERVAVEMSTTMSDEDITKAVNEGLNMYKEADLEERVKILNKLYPNEPPVTVAMLKLYEDSGGGKNPVFRYIKENHPKQTNLYEILSKEFRLSNVAKQDRTAILEDSVVSDLLTRANHLDEFNASNKIATSRVFSIMDKQRGSIVRGSDFITDLVLADGRKIIAYHSKNDVGLINATRNAINKNIKIINDAVGSPVVEIIDKLSVDHLLGYRMVGSQKDWAKVGELLANLKFNDVIFEPAQKLTGEELEFLAKHSAITDLLKDVQNVSKEYYNRLGFKISDDKDYFKHVFKNTEAYQESVGTKYYDGIDVKTSSELSDMVLNLNYLGDYRGVYGAIPNTRTFEGNINRYDGMFSTKLSTIVKGNFTKGIFANEKFQTTVSLFDNSEFKLNTYCKNVDDVKRILNSEANIRNLTIAAPVYRDGVLTGFKKYDNFSDASLEKAISEDAIVVPTNIFATLDKACKHKARMSNKVYAFINRYLTAPFKIGILLNPGFLLGNMNDAYLKQATTMANKYGTSMAEELTNVASSIRSVIYLNNKFSDTYDKYIADLAEYGVEVSPAYKMSSQVANSKTARDNFIKYLNGTLTDKDGMVIIPSITDEEAGIAKVWIHLNTVQPTEGITKELSGDVKTLNYAKNPVDRVLYGLFNYKHSKPETWGLMNNPVSKAVFGASETTESIMRSASILNDLKHQGIDINEFAKRLGETDHTAFNVKMLDAINAMHNANFDYNATAPLLEGLETFVPFPTFWLKNISYWFDMFINHPQYIDAAFTINEGLWANEDTSKDEFKADAKARGAVPMSAFGEQKLSNFFRGIYKPSPLQSMFTAFNAINNPVESLTQRVHPLVQGAGVAVEKGLNTSNLTTNLFKPEDVRYRPYNTDQYQPNINLNDKEFNPLTYTVHKMNPFDRPMNTYLRTPGKVKRGEAQLSDFLPSVFQPDFSKK